MRYDASPVIGTAATLQDVLDRIGVGHSLSETRCRDLRSAVTCYGKLVDQPLSAIHLDLDEIRRTLDGMVPAQAKVSRKRWANLRSDLLAAIAASGLRPILYTSDIFLDAEWSALMAACTDQGIAKGLSRLARWATVRQLKPTAVDTSILERFVAEIETMTLVRKPRLLARTVAKSWNRLVALTPQTGLQPVVVPAAKNQSDRVPWANMPVSFRKEVETYLQWCQVLDPLAEEARPKKLAPATIRLRRDYLHLAASAACAGQPDASHVTSIAVLVEPDTYQAIIRYRWERQGKKITPYLQDLAQGLITIASEWVKAPAEQIAVLKKLRSKLGRGKSGLTEKNKAILRRFDDPHLRSELVQLPDTLWRAALRRRGTSALWFVALQDALAIDILLHVPLRIENLAELKYDEHVHWPQGRSKRALIVISPDDTKNDVPLEFELPLVLSNRLQALRTELAPSVIGHRPDRLFVTRKGKPKAIATIRVGIERTVRRRLGIHMTPHQFRHFAAKLHLEANPGAYELIRQLLGHKSLRTTTRFYAGPDTRRAGRAHAELITRLREAKLKKRERRTKTKESE